MSENPAALGARLDVLCDRIASALERTSGAAPGDPAPEPEPETEPGLNTAEGRPVSASTADWAARYIEKYHLALVEIPPGHKAPLHPGWNKPGVYVMDAEEARRQWGGCLITA